MEVSPQTFWTSKSIFPFEITLWIFKYFWIIKLHPVIWNNFEAITYLDHERPHFHLKILQIIKDWGNIQIPYIVAEQRWNWKLAFDYTVRRRVCQPQYQNTTFLTFLLSLHFFCGIRCQSYNYFENQFPEKIYSLNFRKSRYMLCNSLQPKIY